MEHLRLTEVLFMPAAQPPHKRHLLQADAAHRINMVRLAVSTEERFAVSDLEIRRGGLSYTIDTLQQLIKERPEADWFFIIGSDTLVELHTWHRIEELCDMCTVAAVLRPGTEAVDEIRDRICLPEHCRRTLMDNLISARRVEISSTEIRRKVAAGESISGLVPAAVEAYILEQGLYRT